MALKAKKVQWCNIAQSHQTGEPLLVLDPEVKGYELVELYQWEMCVKFHLQGASEKVPTTDTGGKVRNLIMKLHKECGKDFLVFTKDGKLIQLKAFPKRHKILRSS
eukprot:15339423-Ditylum_brightwellii.AAC.1